MEFEVVDIDNESSLHEENILISNNKSRGLSNNNSLNDYLFNNNDEINSNLNSAYFSNETFL